MDTVKFYREHFGNVSRFEKDYLSKGWILMDEEKKTVTVERLPFLTEK